jgi:uncharacterized protein YndB with AHSA1/START domain
LEGPLFEPKSGGVQAARIEGSINIKRPVDKVFAYTTDVKSMSKWHATVTEPEQTSQGPMGIGTTLRWTNHMMGLRMKTNAKVIEYELNRKWTLDFVVGGSSFVENHLFFDPIEGGTKFTLRYDMKVGGFFKLFSPLIVSSVRKSVKLALKDIKSILEAQT